MTSKSESIFAEIMKTDSLFLFGYHMDTIMNYPKNKYNLGNILTSFIRKYKLWEETNADLLYYLIDYCIKIYQTSDIDIHNQVQKILTCVLYVLQKNNKIYLLGTFLHKY